MSSSSVPCSKMGRQKRWINDTGLVCGELTEAGLCVRGTYMLVSLLSYSFRNNSHTECVCVFSPLTWGKQWDRRGSISMELLSWMPKMLGQPHREWMRYVCKNLKDCRSDLPWLTAWCLGALVCSLRLSSPVWRIWGLLSASFLVWGTNWLF